MARKWWQDAVAYQVYPKSFYDANGDGIGDIRGIIEKLDYLKELGIDLLYMNPVFASPMKDNGYDVSDYYTIDPMFGTNEDMYELINKAAEYKIRIVIDMVVNHCSDQHEWFQKALKDPEGEYADYFYIRKGENGAAPNNWRSIFGGSAWEKIPDSDYYYLHLFTKEQVDLNWDNPKLREEIYQMMNFWLDKGVAGFRLDATAYMKKKEGLPSFEADGPDGLVSVKHGSLNLPGLEVYLKEMKERTYGLRDCFSVGEMEDADTESMKEYISLENGYFSCIYETAHIGLGQKRPNCFWCEQTPWHPDELRKAWMDSQQTICPENWIANFLDNHDMPRSLDRMLPEEGRNYYGASMTGVLYMYMWGTPFIYQGQELGMRNYGFERLEDYDDCATFNQYNIALSLGRTKEEAFQCAQDNSRDNARYPMLWTEAEDAGFSTGKSWLPIPKEHTGISVEAQQNKSDSLLSFYKRMIALKKQEEYKDVFSVGIVKAEENLPTAVLAYYRENETKKVKIICNYQNEQISVSQNEPWKLLLNNYENLIEEKQEIILQPFQAIVIEILKETDGVSAE